MSHANRWCYFISVACTALALCTGTSLAQQRTLQLDINNSLYQAYDSGGNAVPFGGLTHTGSVGFTLQDSTGLRDVLMRSGGPGNPFVHQASYSGSITALAMTILLNNGNVTGGAIQIDINGGPSGGGDRYTSTLEPGGSVQDSVVPQPGAFTIDSLTSHGHFSDTNFGGVAISDFYSSQSTNPFLNGSTFAFKILPNALGKGTADVEVFVTNVPAPGAAGLLGVGAFVAFRRRR